MLINFLTIFITAVELMKENQVKETKYGWNKHSGINRKGALHYISEQSKRFESKI